MGTPIQKNACRYGCSVGGREQGTQRSRLPLPVGSGSLRRKKKSLCTCQKAEDESENDQGPPSDVLSQHAHINTQCQDLHGRVEQVNSNGYHTKGLEQAPRLRKKRRHIIQPLHS